MNRILLASAFALALHGAAAAAPSAEAVQRAGPDRLVVTWTDANPVDVYVSTDPEAGVAQSRLVSRADRDGRAEIAAGVTPRAYVLLKDTRDGAVVRVAERALTLAQGSNFRDIGGYPAAGGKHVRWGRIFRSGATPMLTEADVAAVREVGVKNLIDLRSVEERQLAPTRLVGIRYSAVDYSMASMMGKATAKDILADDRIREVYRQFPAFLAPQMRILFATLLKDDGAVAYNCSAGQDRTGFATALVLSALGTPRDVIFADYHLSTTYRRPKYEMPRIDAATASTNAAAAFFAKLQDDPRSQTPNPLFDSQHKPLLAFALDEIDRRWGSVDAYLQQEVGVSAADIARLRSEYLE